MNGDNLQWIVSALLTTGFAGAVIAYWKDRKKSKAEGYVAENTQELVVDNAKLTNLDTRFQLAQKAWDAERASLLARIAHFEDELREERADHARTKAELENKENKISELERRVSAVQTELRAVNQELSDLRRHPQ